MRWCTARQVLYSIGYEFPAALSAFSVHREADLGQYFLLIHTAAGNHQLPSPLLLLLLLLVFVQANTAVTTTFGLPTSSRSLSVLIELPTAQFCDSSLSPPNLMSYYEISVLLSLIALLADETV
jgi:hypothetical protein